VALYIHTWSNGTSVDCHIVYWRDTKSQFRL